MCVLLSIERRINGVVSRKPVYLQDLLDSSYVVQINVVQLLRLSSALAPVALLIARPATGFTVKLRVELIVIRT